MNKIIGFELKKLLSRIGIYTLVILLAGLMVAGIFMYNPTERNIITYSLAGDTISDMYNNFNGDIKQGYLDSVENIANTANTYIPTSSSYVKYNDKKEINKLFETFDDYCLLYSDATATPDEYNDILVGIQESLLSLKSAVIDTLDISKEMQGYYILTTNSNYHDLQKVFIELEQNFSGLKNPTFAGETYYNEYRDRLYSALQELVYPNLNKTAEKYITTGTYYNLTSSRLNEIELKIQHNYEKVVLNTSLEQDATIKKEINTLFNRYVNCVEMFITSYKTEMCVDSLNTITSKTDRANLLGYSKVSLYQQEELALKYQYYIEKNVSPSDFANSLSISHTSNGKINAYDFTFFVMSLFAIIIMIFAIYLSAHTISGEINNNTMRFTAIRPIKRSSIYMGKYLSIILMSLILLVFGTITSLCVGGIVYGFDSANTLMVVNGSFVMVAHPIAVIILFVVSLLLMIALYSAITMMLSTLFKSDIFAMVISVVLYVLNIILPLFFGIGSWLRFYPFANVNLFAYFSSNKLASDSVLSKLFNTVVYQGMNIWISLIYVVGITTLMLLIGKLIFRKREL